MRLLERDDPATWLFRKGELEGDRAGRRCYRRSGGRGTAGDFQALSTS